MKKALKFLIICGFLFLSTSSLEARKRNSSITTSLGDLLMLIDLSHSTHSGTKVFIDNEDCQCLCSDSQWACVNTEECYLQDEVCLDEKLTYEDNLLKKFTT